MKKTGIITRFAENGPEGVGLAEWDRIDPANLVSGQPVQRGYIYHQDETAGYLVGVWDCTAQTEQMGPYSVDEFMLLLEGTLVMGLPDGSEITIEAGQAFVIPKGFECQWKQAGYVRKFFMILDDPTPELGDNPSLHRITLPDLSGVPDADRGAVALDQVVFVNASGSMRVGVRHFVAAHFPALAVAAHQLIHVLSGRLVLTADGGEEIFECGQTAYIRQGGMVGWQTNADTCLLWASATGLCCRD